MYIVDSTVVVPEEKVEELIEIYQNRSRSVDAWQGFRSFQLLQNDKKPGELTVHMEWDSKEDYMRWATSEEFKRIHELEKNYPDQELANIPPKVSRYKVVAQ
ncbi:antibiotic biosynthesis monooxygenase [Pontibacillus yanchengensis]|uniref:Antibiotic biosynthesis monooxygenase n=2 Tax=Pontibacillus yanchengensis TaxID=462910 RepID=A0ACC7VM75_9BACI|nr:antibiotic biosynthesis monooxygenase family protein [Pontibacillus yanchengensis]MYL33688.1 antibiotic biosynthesis monooxygenase [Pontibacillus yanchengensis]MYL55414.1 antibiotic biosynthesis monooxygenase [Pontibacillus yanchengensis]